jgi:hypothetical protein
MWYANTKKPKKQQKRFDKIKEPGSGVIQKHQPYGKDEQ